MNIVANLALFYQTFWVKYKLAFAQCNVHCGIFTKTVSVSQKISLKSRVLS